MFENYTAVASNYKDQLAYYKDGIDAFKNFAYSNKIKYENNILMEDLKSYSLFEPIILSFEEKKLNEVEMPFLPNF